MHGKLGFAAIVALMVGLTTSASAFVPEWRRVGSRVVEFDGERDVIRLGADEGRFDALKIEVGGGPIELYDVIVTFADGSRFFPKTRFRFAAGTGTRVLDLPGDARVIRQVAFVYRATHRKGTATVTLWARGPWAR